MKWKSSVCNQVKKAEHKQEVTVPDSLKTEFTGYNDLTTEATIIGLIHNNQLVDTVNPGKECWVITQKSPFYVEKGGQISDQGWIEIGGNRVAIQGLAFFNHTIGANIKAPVSLKAGLKVSQVVNKEIRLNTMKNHTATHLLQAALIQSTGKTG